MQAASGHSLGQLRCSMTSVAVAQPGRRPWCSMRASYDNKRHCTRVAKRSTTPETRGSTVYKSRQQSTKQRDVIIESGVLDLAKRKGGGPYRRTKAVLAHGAMVNGKKSDAHLRAFASRYTVSSAVICVMTSTSTFYSCSARSYWP